MYDNILVPTDGSAESEAAFEHALGLAEMHGSTIHALFVVEPVYTGDVGTGQYLDVMEEDGERIVAELAERADSAGAETATDVRVGSPHRQILEYAEENGVDLVVMGTHGRTGLNRYLLGSVTEKVVRLSDVPVLTVRRERDDEE